MTHKEGPAFAQCCFLPRFSLPVHTSVASSVFCFSTSLVSELHIFIDEFDSFICEKYHLSLSRRSPGLLDIQGKDGAIELFEETLKDFC